MIYRPSLAVAEGEAQATCRSSNHPTVGCTGEHEYVRITSGARRIAQVQAINLLTSALTPFVGDIEKLVDL